MRELHLFVLLPSLMPKYLGLQSIKCKTIVTHNNVGHCRVHLYVCKTTFVETAVYIFAWCVAELDFGILTLTPTYMYCAVLMSYVISGRNEIHLCFVIICWHTCIKYRYDYQICFLPQLCNAWSVEAVWNSLHSHIGLSSWVGNIYSEQLKWRRLEMKPHFLGS